MITLKLIALSNVNDDDPDRHYVGDLQLYGVCWTIMSDFIPRTGPLIIFLKVFTRPEKCPRGCGCLNYDFGANEEKARATTGLFSIDFPDGGLTESLYKDDSEVGFRLTARGERRGEKGEGEGEVGSKVGV